MSSSEEDRRLITCYPRVFDAADQDVKTKVAKNLYQVYRTEPEALVLAYEDTFFRGSDLAYLSENERCLIKAHLLPRVEAGTLNERICNLVGIGPFLSAEEAFAFCLTLIAAIQGEDEKRPKEHEPGS
jgi:hypothetical protein